MGEGEHSGGMQLAAGSPQGGSPGVMLFGQGQLHTSLSEEAIANPLLRTSDAYPATSGGATPQLPEWSLANVTLTDTTPAGVV